MLFFEIATLSVAGFLVGNELAIAIFVHPTLSRLPDSVHLTAATALARMLGRVMPFWYALTIALTVTLALSDWHSTGRWPQWIVIMGAVNRVHDCGFGPHQQQNCGVDRRDKAGELEEFSITMG